MTEDVITFEVRVRAKSASAPPTESELQCFKDALSFACQDVLGRRGLDIHADKFDVFITNVVV